MPEPAPRTLDAALDRISPARAADPDALERAYRRLTAAMAHADPSASRAAVRRRLVGTLAVAAVGAGVVVGAQLGAGGTDHRPGHVGADPTLVQLAGFLRAQPAATTGQYVRIVDTHYQSNVHPGSKAAPTPQTSVTTIYQPASLNDAGTPWVTEVGGVARSAPCAAFDQLGVTDPCAPGTWAAPNPAFLAELGAESPAAVTAGLAAYLNQDRRGGGSVAAGAVWWMMTALPVAVGDHAATANIIAALASIAAGDPGMSATHSGSIYRISATVRGVAATDVIATISYDTSTGAYALTESRGGAVTQRDAITTSIVAADAVPAATPWSPRSDNHSGGVPQSSPVARR